MRPGSTRGRRSSLVVARPLSSPLQGLLVWEREKVDQRLDQNLVASHQE